MFALPFFPSPSVLYVRALNVLLQRESWARERLMPHAGKAIFFGLGPLSANMLVQPEGLLAQALAGHSPDVSLVLPAERLGDGMALLAKGQPAALADLMQVQGDAGLANVVSMLATHLRPDPEQELANWFGDSAAVRLVGLGRATANGVRQAAGRVASNVAEYVSEEAGLMATRPAFNDFTHRLERLRIRLDSLDARLSSAGRPVAHRPLRGA